jgi:hypothetical protein
MCIGRIRNERFFTCWSRSPLLIGLPFALALRGWLKLIARAFGVVILKGVHSAPVLTTAQ